MAVRVAIDALGGDHAPDEVVAGARAAASEALAPVLFGPPRSTRADVELVACTDEIAMHEKPAEAVRGKPDSSLVRAVRAVGTETLRPSCRPAIPAPCSPRPCSTSVGCSGVLRPGIASSSRRGRRC